VSLLIPFDPSGLDAKVVSALDDIIAAVQTWSASPFGLARKRMRVTSAVQTITTGTDPFSVTWSAPPNGSDRALRHGRVSRQRRRVYQLHAGWHVSDECERGSPGSAVGDPLRGHLHTNDLIRVIYECKCPRGEQPDD
jgi:hypothetical protein